MTALALVMVLLASSEGAHRVPNEHHLRNVASLGKHHLMLVTIDNAKRDEVDVREGIGDGPLSVPSGEGLVSRLFALTDAEADQLAIARTRAALRYFFAREDLARSESLAAWSFTSDPDDDAPNIIDWTVEGIDGYRIVMTGQTRLPSAPLKVGVLLAVGGLALLGLVLFLFLRRRMSTR